MLYVDAYNSLENLIKIVIMYNFFLFVLGLCGPIVIFSEMVNLHRSLLPTVMVSELVNLTHTISYARLQIMGYRGDAS